MPVRGRVRPAYSVGMTTTARRDETITAPSLLRSLLTRRSSIGLDHPEHGTPCCISLLFKTDLSLLPGNLQKGREKGGRVGESARREWRGKDRGGQGCQGASHESALMIILC